MKSQLWPLDPLYISHQKKNCKKAKPGWDVLNLIATDSHSKYYNYYYYDNNEKQFKRYVIF